jgi:hypothetical protein
VVVAAPPCGEGQAYTSLLDLTLLTGATLVAAPLPLVMAAMRVYKGTAAIVPRGTHVPGVPATRVFPVALSRDHDSEDGVTGTAILMSRADHLDPVVDPEVTVRGGLCGRGGTLIASLCT